MSATTAPGAPITTRPAGPAPDQADNLRTLAYKLGYDHGLHNVTMGRGLILPLFDQNYDAGYDAGELARQAAS